MYRIISKFFRVFGHEIKRGSIIISGVKVENNFFKRHQWIQRFNFQTILDIGANQGQFASRFRLLFPNATIYCFEPIPEVFELLCNRFKNDPKFKGFNVGLGSEKGSFEFYQNDFSDSSSLLPMKNLHKENFPFAQYEKIIKIQVEELDEFVERFTLTNPLLIKIDVQGFEKMVILGGKKTIKKALFIIVEVSFYELYENQIYFDSIYSILRDLGFKYMGNYEQLISPKDGSVLQADALFLNENVSGN